MLPNEFIVLKNEIPPRHDLPVAGKQEIRFQLGQFFYASAGDIIILNRPMQLNGPVKFIRKNGMWTLDELTQIIPPMVDI